MPVDTDRTQDPVTVDSVDPVDPRSLEPLCDEEEFTAELEQLATDEAPRLFAVMQVLGDRVDGWVAAWGMAFGDRAEVVSTDGGRRLSLGSPERAVQRFAHAPEVSARLVWMDLPPGAPAAGAA
ncbi:hypothetical protein [Streptomyces sp. NPDC093109]|uniref:hypothetical protein n=1 Tax=Streptomyces sp. NPDC093109 TaxID=3154977 RepID=UPI00344C6923